MPDWRCFVRLKQVKENDKNVENDGCEREKSYNWGDTKKYFFGSVIHTIG